MKNGRYEEYYDEDDFEEEEQEPKKKRKRGRKGVFMGLLIFFLGIAIFVLGFILLFHVQKITVTGNQYCTTNEVIQWVQQDKYSGNSLYILAKYNLTNVEQLPLVEQAEVSLKNPWTVQVRVYEKTLIGYFDLNGEGLYFDKDGVAMIKTLEPLENIPYIEGLDIDPAQVKLHEPLPIDDRNVFQSILDITQLLEKHALTPDRIVLSGGSVNLHFGPVTVQLGTGDFADKTAQISPILQKLNEQFAGQAGVLHLENFSRTNDSVSFVPTPQE